MSRYEGTLFDTSKVFFQVPIKKSESRNYFFRVPIKGIGYIPLDTFFILFGFYGILTLFWFNLYQEHFLITSGLTLFNVIISTIVLFRHQQSGKNMFDMIRLIYRYIKKKHVYLLKPNKIDKFSQFQVDEINVVKEQGTY